MINPLQLHVSVEAVETYVNEPDHEGGIDPFARTPGFDGSTFPRSQRIRTYAREIRPVRHLAIQAPALVRTKGRTREALHCFVELRTRLSQSFDLANR